MVVERDAQRVRGFRGLRKRKESMGERDKERVREREKGIQRQRERSDQQRHIVDTSTSVVVTSANLASM